MKNRKQIFIFLPWLVLAINILIQMKLKLVGDALKLLNFITFFPFVFSIYKWFYYDAKYIGFEYSTSFKLGVIFLSPIFVPYYVIKTSKSRNLIFSLLKFLGLLIITIVGLTIIFTV